MSVGSRSWAASYDLWIGSTQVTDDNKNNIRPSGLKSGQIYFFQENGKEHGNYLVLKDVTFETGEFIGCIKNRMSGGLNIFVYGTVNLTSKNMHTIYSSTWLRITSGSAEEDPATLNLTSGGNPESTGYNIYQSSDEELFIDNIYLNATTSGSVAIRGNTEGILHTNAAQIDAEGAEEVISYFKSWTMESAGMLFDDKGYDTKSQCVRLDGGTGYKSKQCKLVNGLYVGRRMIQLEMAPRYFSSGEGMTGGKVSWTFYSNTLELEDVTYALTLPFVRNYNVPDLIIKIAGNNSISCNDVQAFLLYQNTTFTGEGSLSASGRYGISVYRNTTTTVGVNGTVQFRGKDFGYYCSHNSRYPNSDLVLKNTGTSSDYYFWGGTSGITDCSHLELDGMDFFSSPSYGTPCCYFDNDTHNVKKQGGSVVSQSDINFFGIKNLYPISIAGQQLNNCNRYYGPGSPYIFAGTVYYSPDDNLLQIEGLRMNTSANEDIYGISAGSNNDYLTIDFAGGDNQNLSSSRDVLYLACNTTITGTSPVTLNSTKESGISTASGSSVTINTNGFMEVKGAKYGYWGNGGTNEKLTLSKQTSDNKAYRFIGSQGAIYNVTDLVLDNMDFWEGYSITDYPEDGYLDGCYFGNRSVRVNGGAIACGTVAFGSVKKSFPVSVCGKQINSTQVSPTSKIYVGSPFISSSPTSVAYNPTTNTLNLNGAVVNYDRSDYLNYGVITTGDGAEVNISVQGDNSLSGENLYSGLWVTNNGKVTIDGQGTLNLVGGYDDLYAQTGSKVAIKGDVTLKAKHKGIGTNSTAKELSVGDNAIVEAEHISQVESLVLGGDRRITNPSGAAFSAADKAVMRNGALAHNVVIEGPREFPL